MSTAAHPIANPAIIIAAAKALAIMAYPPNRVALGTPATPKIAIPPNRAFPSYLFICFFPVFDEEIIKYDLKNAKDP